MASSRAGLLLFGCLTIALPAAPRRTEPRLFIRVNQLGYLSASPKVAVVCALDSVTRVTFSVTDAIGRRVLGPGRVLAALARKR